MARLKGLIPRENKLRPEQRREALELGKWGEQMVTKYLEDNGYTILERNYRKGHLEIDIIALDPPCCSQRMLSATRNVST